MGVFDMDHSLFTPKLTPQPSATLSVCFKTPNLRTTILPMSTQHEGQAGLDGACDEFSGISDDELSGIRDDEFSGIRDDELSGISDDESSGDTSDDLSAATILKTRIALWQYQLRHERLTPLLQMELQRLIKEMSEALKQPTFPEGIDLESLDAQHRHVSKHWGKIFQHPYDRTQLLMNMSRYEALFAEMLLEDYASRPARMPVLNDWLLDRATKVLEHNEVPGFSMSNDKQKQEHYYDNVKWPLEEMTLGGLVSHAERKLCEAVLAREGGSQGPGGYVSQLIQQCEWEKLAEALVYDRRLAVTLSGIKPVGQQRNWKGIFPRVLHKMDDMERKYFTNLSSPDNYIISKHAADLLARHSSNKSNHVPLPRMPAAGKLAPNITNTIKNRLRLFKTGLTLRTERDSATSNAKSDEHGHLLHLDEKSTATSSFRSDEKVDQMGSDEKEV